MDLLRHDESSSKTFQAQVTKNWKFDRVGIKIFDMQRDMQHDNFYQDMLRPLLFRLDPEDAHNLIHKLLNWFGAVLPSLPYKYEGGDLETQIGQTLLPNPIGLAAGFDKNAHLVSVLGDLGFGFAEIGSITAKATLGNPRPRLFRLPADRALINRLGLNGEGADVVSEKLRSSKLSLPIGINIAKTHDPAIAGDAAVDDILYSFKRVSDLRPLYIALNASCPNTQEGCIEERKLLDDVLREMQKLNTDRVPLLIKVSPDSTDQLLNDIVEVASNNNVRGYVCGNTTITRNQLKTNGTELQSIGKGGLSGPPLMKLSLQTTRKVARLKRKEQFIIAVGGISSGEDVYTFIRSGASAVEIYTALVYFGPTLIRRMCEELSSLLKRDGISLKEAIGADLKS